MVAEAAPPGSVPSRLERGFVAANRWALIGLMAAMVALVFGNVVSRYVFNHSITWAEELSQYFMVWIAFLGAGLAMREGRHVAVELLQDVLPLPARKAMRLAVALAILAFMAVVAVLGFRFAAFAWSLETPVLQIPLGIPYLAVPVGVTVFLAHFLFFFREFVERRFEEPEHLEPVGDMTL